MEGELTGRNRVGGCRQAGTQARGHGSQPGFRAAEQEGRLGPQEQAVLPAARSCVPALVGTMGYLQGQWATRLLEEQCRWWSSLMGETEGQPVSQPYLKEQKEPQLCSTKHSRGCARGAWPDPRRPP